MELTFLLEEASIINQEFLIPSMSEALYLAAPSLCVHSKVHICLTELMMFIGQPDKCMCIRMAQLDPKGMIPAWVVSIGKRRAATSFANLRRVAEQDISGQADSDDEEETKQEVSPVVESLLVPKASESAEQLLTKQEEVR
jgi:hypothetical protein